MIRFQARRTKSLFFFFFLLHPKLLNRWTRYTSNYIARNNISKARLSKSDRTPASSALRGERKICKEGISYLT